MRNLLIGLIAACAVSLLVAIQWFVTRRRTVEIQSLAARYGLHYIGEALPGSLSLVGTPMEKATSIANTIDGEFGSIRVIAFDCEMGLGRGSWRRTVIAAKTFEEIFGSPVSNLPMKIEQCNDWLVLYLPWGESFFSTGLMSVEELDAYLNGIKR